MRLTELVNKGMNETPIYVGSYGNIVNVGDNQATSMAHHKLGQLEDIEDELGIDLLTLFKALKNGIYLKFGSEKVTGVYYEHRAILPRHFDKDYKGYFIDLQLELSINFNFYFKDYGKTWALDKEELENEK